MPAINGRRSVRILIRACLVGGFSVDDFGASSVVAKLEFRRDNTALKPTAGSLTISTGRTLLRGNRGAHVAVRIFASAPGRRSFSFRAGYSPDPCRRPVHQFRIGWRPKQCPNNNRNLGHSLNPALWEYPVIAHRRFIRLIKQKSWL